MERIDTTIRIDPSHSITGTPRGWFVRAGLHFHEVETLLDGLEAAGIADREIEIEIEGTFQVRWRMAA